MEYPTEVIDTWQVSYNDIERVQTREDLDQEVVDRIAADISLSNLIVAEEQARIAGDAYLQAEIIERDGYQYHLTVNNGIRIPKTVYVGKSAFISGAVFKGYETKTLESTYLRRGDNTHMTYTMTGMAGLAVTTDTYIDGDLYIFDDCYDGYDTDTITINATEQFFGDDNQGNYTTDNFVVNGNVYVRGNVWVGDRKSCLTSTNDVYIPMSVYVSKTAFIKGSVWKGFDTKTLTLQPNIEATFYQTNNPTGLATTKDTYIDGDLFIIEDCYDGYDTNTITVTATTDTFDRTKERDFITTNLIATGDIYVRGNVYIGGDSPAAISFANAKEYPDYIWGSCNIAYGAIKPIHLDLSDPTVKVGVATYTPNFPLDVNGSLNATIIHENGVSLSNIYRRVDDMNIYIDASQIISGTLSNARLPPAISVTSVTANTFIGDGSQLTGIVAETTEVPDLSITNAKIANQTIQIGKINPTNLSGIGTKLLTDSNVLIKGLATVQGTLTVDNLNVIGDTTIINTETQVTDQVIITNSGTAPALRVEQSGLGKNIAEFIDTEGGSVIIADTGSVGIGVTNPTQKLDVNGVVKATSFQGNLSSSYITGSITDAQITSLATTKLSGSIINTQIASLDASKLSGSITDAQITSLATSKLTGSITDAQITSLDATKLTGSITDAQITSLATSKLTGSITDAQITSLATTKLTGSITDAQITSLDASKLTGSITDAQITSLDATKLTGTIDTARLPTINEAAGWKRTGTDVTLVTYTDKVGIGVATPLQKLHVDGNIQTPDVFVGNTGTAGWAAFSHKDRATSSDYAIFQNASGRTIINSSTGQPIQFRTNNVDQMALSNGYFGIGTATPNLNLHVEAGSTSTGGIRVSGTANPRIQVENAQIGHAHAVNAYATNAVIGDVVFRNFDSTKKLHLLTGAGTPALTVTNTNVGIGTVNPTDKLVVENEGTGVTTRLAIRAGMNADATTNKAEISLITRGGGGGTLTHSISSYYTANANYAMNFITNAVERMTITDSGRVGIGKTNPSTALDVNGAITAGLITCTASSASEGGEIQLNAPTGITGAWSIDANSTNFRIFNTLSGVTTVNATIGATGNMSVVGTVTATQFNGSGAGLTNIPVQASGGGWTDGGTSVYPITLTDKVAVGTNTPVSIFTVNPQVIDRSTFDHSGSPITITHPTATSTTVLNDKLPVLHLCRQGTGGQAYGARATFALSRYENAGTSSVGSRTRLDLQLAHDAYDTIDVMSIRSDGRVGIGKTNPTTALDVNGTVTATAFSGSGASLTGVTVTGANVSGDITGGSFIVNDATSTGSTRPAKGMYVWTDKLFGMELNNANSTWNTTFVTRITDGGFHWKRSDHTSFMYMNNSGNLGIGCNPSAKLHVQAGSGNGGATTGMIIETQVGTTDTTDSIIIQQNTGYASSKQALTWKNVYTGYVYNMARIWSEVGSGYTATKMGFDVADSSRNIQTRMVIDVNGRVGIGKNNPATALDVTGTINANYFTASVSVTAPAINANTFLKTDTAGNSAVVMPYYTYRINTNWVYPYSANIFYGLVESAGVYLPTGKTYLIDGLLLIGRSTTSSYYRDLGFTSSVTPDSILWTDQLTNAVTTMTYQVLRGGVSVPETSFTIKLSGTIKLPTSASATSYVRFVMRSSIAQTITTYAGSYIRFAEIPTLQGYWG